MISVFLFISIRRIIGVSNIATLSFEVTDLGGSNESGSLENWRYHGSTSS